MTAKDGTILAGHGIVTAAQKLGLERIPIIRLDVGPEEAGALKVLIGDNEIEHLAEQNDRLLTELLKSVKENDAVGLLGTGFDEMMLANFLLVTRPSSEIADLDAAAQWVGLPDYQPGAGKIQLIVTFPDEAKREVFVQKAELRIDKKVAKTWATRWPWTDREDASSVRFKAEA